MIPIAINRIYIRIKKVILSDLTSLRWVMGMLGITMALGLSLAKSDYSDYSLMHRILTTDQWIIAFFSIWSNKIIYLP